MSGINVGVENEDGYESEMQTLSTGMENLDHAIEGHGIHTGSLIGVISHPNSPGDVLIANMISNRPTYYYTLGRSEEHVKKTINDVPNVSFETTHISSVDSENPIQTLRAVLKNTDLPRGANVIIDPVNVIEQMDYEAFKEFIGELQAKVDSVDGLGILHGLKSQNEMQNRWFTMGSCNTVFELIHKEHGESVTEYLTIQKLYPGQELVNNDTRRFELDRSLNIDITTSRNISP